MKKLLITAMLLPSIAVAGVNQPVSDEQHEKNCMGLMAMAQAVMTVRQNGLPLAEALINAEKLVKDNKASKEENFILKGMLRDAYDEARYSTKAYQQEQINEFSAKYYLACMEMYE